MIKAILTTFLICSFFLNVSALDTCLIACYPFNGNANNELGTGFNGVVVGATLTADRYGNLNAAYQFDGLDDRIVLGMLNLMNNTDEFTYSFWCLANSTSATNIPIRTQPDFSTDRLLFAINYVGGSPTRLFFDCGNINTTGRIGSNTQPYDNNWHHYVFVRSTSNNIKKVYIDGVLFLSGTAGDILHNKNKELWIGGGFHENGSIEFHNGKIDDVKIFNCALPEPDIMSLFHDSSNCIISNINENLFNEQITIFPSPSNEYITINLNLDIKLDKICFYNNLGKEVLTIDTPDKSNTIDISNLPKGIYIVKLLTEKSSLTKRIIVN